MEQHDIASEIKAKGDRLASKKLIPNKIQILPKDLSEKIAAGEVIERPASVVKELVENSIDAGATEIRIELQDAGKKKIQISDNGTGMNDDDVLVSIERHATSKISYLDDLWNLNTMGFRGEALPSIAAISRFTIDTKASNQNGTRVYFEAGTLKNHSLSEKIETGTTITVEDLFYNVPARLKFQKTRSTEAAFIREMLEHFALTHPKVAFTLVHDDRKSFSYKIQSEHSKRIQEIFETKNDSDLEYIESKYHNIEIHGWLDRNARMPNSKSIFISVNKRIVRDKLLLQSVISALKPRMMEGEFPRIALFVQVAPNELDVNVHPTKTEVRFQKSKDVFQVVHGALSKLATTAAKPYYSTNFAKEMKPEALFQEPIFSKDIFQYKIKSNNLTEPTSEIRIDSDKLKLEAASQNHLSTSSYSYSLKQELNAITSPSMHYIGQLKNTYLLFQDADGLVLIDQHAAHERINYEKIKNKFFTNSMQKQPLLMSITVKCTPEDQAFALENSAFFTKLGFELESFGEKSLLLRSIPQGVSDKHALELFNQLLSEIKESTPEEVLESDPTKISPHLDRMLATTACHSSIRAGQTLSSWEAKDLFNQMQATDSSLNCPHGRPASIQLSFDQIETLFKRKV